MSKRIAIIAGVGPGTGSSIAHRFSKSYPVVLLSRNPDNFTPTVSSITSAGGHALGISTDLSSPASVSSMVDKIKAEFGADVTAAAGIFNASGGFVRKPFLETTEEEWESGYRGSVTAGFHFARAVLPLLQPGGSATEQTGTAATAGEGAAAGHPPSLIFTGATASVKANPNFALFASTKHALRAMAQSLAREYGPKGVHVAHAIIDGVIDIPRTKGWDLGPGGKIAPEDIAEAYWWLHAQPKTGWTWEVDLRPAVEKW